MIRLRRFLPVLVAALGGATMVGFPAQAVAGFSLNIQESGGASVTVNDGDANDLDHMVNGQIIFSSAVSGSLGAFNINITTGSSNAPGTPQLAQLTINDLSTSSAGFSGTRTLTFSLEDTGFTSPTGETSLVSELASTALAAASSVTYQSFLNGNPGTLLTLNNVNASGVVANDAVNISGTPYTLKSVTIFTVTGQGTGTNLTVQANGITAVAPAPQGLALALSALPMLGVVGLYYRRRTAATVVLTAA
jgi:hypothetical protein